MIRDKIRVILSLNGISILIGIVGGIIGLTAIFIDDWDLKIGIRWFALLIILFLFVILIVSKLAYELFIDLKKTDQKSIRVISYMPETFTLLAEKSDLLEYSARVTIFYIDNNFQIEAAQGFVQNIQDNFIQIKITKFDEAFESNSALAIEFLNNNNVEVLRKLSIKSYIRYTE